MSLDAHWIEAALSITGDFETSGDPWTAVSPDFDKMGISCGPLQWNIGQGSLQRIVLPVGRAVVGQAMPLFGSEFWSACSSSIAAGLSIVRGWQSGNKLRPEPQAELVNLLRTNEMRRQMLVAVDQVARQSFSEAQKWEGTSKTPSGKNFCWFFDLITQNGGLSGLDRDDVKLYIAAHGIDRADDAICDWLLDRPILSGHDRDAQHNAKIWRDNATGDTLDLLVLSFLRSQKSNQQWRHVVLNRKGTIAMGYGRVNGEVFNLHDKFPA